MLSCQSINASVYFAPKEIRTCCQRYFRKGQLMGDVKLLKTEGLTALEIARQIIAMKRRLIDDINSSNTDPCTGCHSLSLISPNILINHISIEDSTICNMRCSYCSSTYFGGEETKVTM